MENLYNELKEYASGDSYPFHMPGHKRNIRKLECINPYQLDITEIDGFDNLHNPEGILRECLEEAARFYKTKKTYFLVNGSTCGILAAISAATLKNKKILIARNCHVSVYNTVYLRNLQPAYLYSEIIEPFGIQGEIRVEEVEKALCADPQIGTVVIVSPTYDGLVSDIRAIAGVVHSHEAVLIVDEAHGAHFGMHEMFPPSAISLGADLVIQSLHKTLPSFTQTALLHLCSERISSTELERFLSIFQTSSPSYVLMAGIDRCIRMMSTEGKQLFESYAALLLKYRNQMKSLKKIRLFDGGSTTLSDPSKLLFSVRGCAMTGSGLSEILRLSYGLQMEMASSDYILALSSCMDTEEGFVRLCNALNEIDLQIKGSDPKEQNEEPLSFRAETVISIKEALESKAVHAEPNALTGRISAEFIYLYPPGIPLLVPGERITDSIIKIMKNFLESGLKLSGPESGKLESIKVVQENT